MNVHGFLPERQTERLLLRRPTVDDIDAIFAIHADPATNRFNPAPPMTYRD